MEPPTQTWTRLCRAGAPGPSQPSSRLRKLGSDNRFHWDESYGVIPSAPVTSPKLGRDEIPALSCRLSPGPGSPDPVTTFQVFGSVASYRNGPVPTRNVLAASPSPPIRSTPQTVAVFGSASTLSAAQSQYGSVTPATAA